MQVNWSVGSTSSRRYFHPNVFVQDGVQPLFEFAAAPFSDRSSSSDVGPSSVSSEVEPLLEFAARHVALQFDSAVCFAATPV